MREALADETNHVAKSVEEWKMAISKRKHKSRKQKEKGTVIVSGPNVRCLAFRTWENSIRQVCGL